jgi:hypothetical protein
VSKPIPRPSGATLWHTNTVQFCISRAAGCRTKADTPILILRKNLIGTMGIRPLAKHACTKSLCHATAQHLSANLLCGTVTEMQCPVARSKKTGSEPVLDLCQPIKRFDLLGFRVLASATTERPLAGRTG